MNDPDYVDYCARYYGGEPMTPEDRYRIEAFAWLRSFCTDIAYFVPMEPITTLSGYLNFRHYLQSLKQNMHEYLSNPEVRDMINEDENIRRLIVESVPQTLRMYDDLARPWLEIARAAECPEGYLPSSGVLRTIPKRDAVMFVWDVDSDLRRTDTPELQYGHAGQMYTSGWKHFEETYMTPGQRISQEATDILVALHEINFGSIVNRDIARDITLVSVDFIQSILM